MCKRAGYYAYECKTKQNTLAVEAELSSGVTGQPKQFDNPSGFQSNRQNRGHIRGRGLWSMRGRGRGRGQISANVQQAKANTEKQNNVCGSCSILTSTITESTAILSSAYENQLCHPPRMPVSQCKVNGQKVTLLRDTGCSGVVIKRDLVRDNQLNGKSQLCILIDGTKLPAPVANIFIDTPYYTGDVEACV